MSTMAPMAREVSEKIHRYATPTPSESIDFVVETPGAPRPLLFVSVYYSKDSGKRGFYLSLTPGERNGMFNRYHIMEGIRVFLSPAPIARVSKKAKTDAIAGATPSVVLCLLESILEGSR